MQNHEDIVERNALKSLVEVYVQCLEYDAKKVERITIIADSFYLKSLQKWAAGVHNLASGERLSRNFARDFKAEINNDELEKYVKLHQL